MIEIHYRKLSMFYRSAAALFENISIWHNAPPFTQDLAKLLVKGGIRWHWYHLGYNCSYRILESGKQMRKENREIVTGEEGTYVVKSWLIFYLIFFSGCKLCISYSSHSFWYRLKCWKIRWGGKEGAERFLYYHCTNDISSLFVNKVTEYFRTT